MKLTGIYSTLFTNKFGTKDSGVWLETLKTLTPKALESGMERLKNLSGNGKFAEFPPNCLQFKALCEDFYQELRLPSTAEAYRETIASERREPPHWSHLVVQYTASRLPQEFWAIENAGESWAIFDEAYNKVCNLVRQGNPLPMQNMPPRTEKIRNPSIALSHLQQMRRHLGVQ